MHRCADPYERRCSPPAMKLEISCFGSFTCTTWRSASDGEKMKSPARARSLALRPLVVQVTGELQSHACILHLHYPPFSASGATVRSPTVDETSEKQARRDRTLRESPF